MQLGRYSVELSHPDKVLFPDSGITKRDIAEYYRDIAGLMLPHLRARPVTMQRFPDGTDGKSFFHKDVPDYFPDWIETASMRKEGGKVTHALAASAATLVYLANQACITPHVWLSRVDRPDHPDMLVFDLDPPEEGHRNLCPAARQVRDLLEELGLATFVKTTGSRGLHVVSPLDRIADFSTTRKFAQDVAGLLAKRNPDWLTTEPRKNKRGDRIFVDTARNAYAQTVAPPYSIRPGKGAPIATPIHWEELRGGDNISQRYTLKSIRRRLGQTGDVWKGIGRHARGLGGPRRRLEQLLGGSDS